MADYSHMLTCPSCGMRDLNLLNFDTLMVIKQGIGMFTIECPTCSERVSSIQPIPIDLFGEVEAAAVEMGCGMGNGI